MASVMPGTPGSSGTVKRLTGHVLTTLTLTFLLVGGMLPKTPRPLRRMRTIMTRAAIEVSGLRKVYKTALGKTQITALDGIDFSVAEGELFGLLGPNGAGKTTTVKILLDLTRATHGSAMISGIPVGDPESRRHVGYLP